MFLFEGANIVRRKRPEEGEPLHCDQCSRFAEYDVNGPDDEQRLCVPHTAMFMLETATGMLGAII